MLVPDVPTILLLESYTFDRVPHMHKECEWRGSVLPKCSISLSNHQSKIQVIICPCEACYILKSKAEVKSNEYSTCPCVCTQSLGHVWLGATPWTVAHQAPLSMGFPRQENCSGVAISSPRGSAPPRGWTQVSCTGRWILSHWPPGRTSSMFPWVFFK